MDESFTTPAWVKNAVFYQIFPERFCNGDASNDPPNVKPWGTAPDLHNFMGGDLQGIIDRLGYLEELGINALYLCPIFAATSNHKYNTFDYFKIDPHFGTVETFREVIDAAHRRGIRVVLDGVFNHCGRGLFQFHDVMENGEYSPYRDWFHVQKFPLHAYEEGKKPNYLCWWDIRSLPKLNTDNPHVRQFLLDVARYWIEAGADGWRLDVPNEIADHAFWREFRSVVKRANPEAYIVGEIWEDGAPWLQGDQFDAVMNYVFRDRCTEFFAESKLDAIEFGQKIDELLRHYSTEVTYAQLNLLGSHDTARFLTAAGGDLARMKLAATFQMTYPGAPCIYYGDEIGMSGASDPHCRGCFPWDESKWDHELRGRFRRLITLRHAHAALRTGKYRTLPLPEAPDVYAFARWDASDTFVIALNNSEHSAVVTVPIPEDVPVANEFELAGDSRAFGVNHRTISGLALGPREGAVLRAVR